MKGVVVEASVAVKWVVGEEHSDRSLAILRDVPGLYAPAPWLAEAGNTLWAKAAIHHVINSAEMHQRLAFLSSLPVAVTPLSEIIGAAGALALDLHLTVYDTLYLILAEKIDVPLVTADRMLYERASQKTRFVDLDSLDRRLHQRAKLTAAVSINALARC